MYGFSWNYSHIPRWRRGLGTRLLVIMIVNFPPELTFGLFPGLMQHLPHVYTNIPFPYKMLTFHTARGPGTRLSWPALVSPQNTTRTKHKKQLEENRKLNKLVSTCDHLELNKFTKHINTMSCNRLSGICIQDMATSQVLISKVLKHTTVHTTALCQPISFSLDGWTW